MTAPVPADATVPQVAVGGVVVHNGQLLLVRRGNEPQAGKWSIPGGRVRAGEPLWEAVVREVAEETGVEVAVDSFLGWVERIDPSHHFVVLDFAATPLDAEPVASAGDDATAAEWVPLEDLGTRDLVDGLADFLVEVGVFDPARVFGI